MEKIKLILPVVFVLGLTFACSVLGVLVYVPDNRIRATFENILATFQTMSLATIITVALALIVLAVAGAALLLALGYQKAALGYWDVQEKRVNVHRLALVFEAPPPGHGFYKTNVMDNLTTALHLEAGSVNGDRLTPTEERLQRWAHYQLMHATLRLPKQSLELLTGPEGPRVLEPILPRLIAAQRLILAGGSDAGKTTLVKWIIDGRRDHSKIIIIDPHSPSKVLGVDVIGAGRDYQAIGDALESLCLLMTSRYEDVKAGLFGYGEHERISIFIDEWTSIQRHVKHAGDMLQTLLTESRKVAMHLTFCCHSTTTDVLGVDAQIRKSATIVELTGGNGGQQRRAFIQPQSRLTPEGKKAEPIEYSLPGPFEGYARPAGDVVQELPDKQAIKARILAGQGFTITSIAKELFGTSNPNGRQIQAAKDLLGLTPDERQAAT